nr:MAG TPA: hypothetical protein [Caudoviricetes sp.]
MTCTFNCATIAHGWENFVVVVFLCDREPYLLRFPFFVFIELLSSRKGNKKRRIALEQQRIYTGHEETARVSQKGKDICN